MSKTADTSDSFRPRLAEMIDLRHPLAILASRLSWAQIEAVLVRRFARRVRQAACSNTTTCSAPRRCQAVQAL
jgi:hypothetical protein